MKTRSPKTNSQADDRLLSSPRDLPSVEELLSDDGLAELMTSSPRRLIVSAVREVLASFRQKLAASDDNSPALKRQDLLEEIRRCTRRLSRQSYQRVINCTGALGHTNLGRSPLGREVWRKLAENFSGYGNLEFDLTSGSRGVRGQEVVESLAELTGAESALIVNNCAAAVFLALNTFSNRRRTILSRGELVQIGGGFRVPDILKKSGAKLVEVGTTNITTVADYASALDDSPGLILKVSRSNFSQSGFVDEPSLAELVTLARERQVTLVYDLGSGLVVDPREVNLQGQPSVISAVRDGADLICFSGDKLFGGAQAGLLVGRREMIDKLKRNPLYRTLRPDKLTLALTGATINAYLGGTWKTDIPLWRLALRAESELYEFGRQVIEELDASDKLTLESSSARFGGGAAPDVEIPSCALTVGGAKVGKESCKEIARVFRELEIPLIGYVDHDRFHLDLRTVLPEDEKSFIAGIKEALAALDLPG